MLDIQCIFYKIKYEFGLDSDIKQLFLTTVIGLKKKIISILNNHLYHLKVFLNALWNVKSNLFYMRLYLLEIANLCLKIL